MDHVPQRSASEILESINVRILIRSVASFFDQIKVLRQNRANSHSNLFGKVLERPLHLRINQGHVLFSQISVLGNYGDLLDKYTEEHAYFLLVEVFHLLLLIFERNHRDLREELNCLYASTRRANQVAQYVLNKLCLEHVTKWDP